MQEKTEEQELVGCRARKADFLGVGGRGGWYVHIPICVCLEGPLDFTGGSITPSRC